MTDMMQDKEFRSLSWSSYLEYDPGRALNGIDDSVVGAKASLPSRACLKRAFHIARLLVLRASVTSILASCFASGVIEAENTLPFARVKRL